MTLFVELSATPEGLNEDRSLAVRNTDEGEMVQLAADLCREAAKAEWAALAGRHLSSFSCS